MVHILYRDDHVIGIEKPGGLLAVPGKGPDKQDCVVSRVKEVFPSIIEQPAVHRLDMYTSGVMILARTAGAHRNLSIQFQEKEIKKTYIALLDGIVKEQHGRIDLRFRLDINNRPCQIYDPDSGKRGVTLWKNISIENSMTRIEFTPLTGRTHQLRLHAAHRRGLATPIVGDSLYGRGSEGDRMMLHATCLSFAHPHSGEQVTISSPVPF